MGAYIYIFTTGYYQRLVRSMAAEGERRLRIACHTSDNPLAPRDWTVALVSHDVIVATGQTVLNALEAGTDRLAAVRFLVCANTQTITLA